MKIKELANAPQWLIDAIVRDEDVEIDQYGRVQWNRGEWLVGDFRGGNFLGGNFRGGNFRGGDFRGGDFRGGDFWGGNFRGGDFLGGDFRGGDFRGGNFRGHKIAKNPLSFYGFKWPVYISENHMAIGCQMHEHKAWAAFDDAEINRMDTGALKFWRKHGPALLMMCKQHAGGDEE